MEERNLWHKCSCRTQSLPSYLVSHPSEEDKVGQPFLFAILPPSAALAMQVWKTGNFRSSARHGEKTATALALNLPELPFSGWWTPHGCWDCFWSTKRQWGVLLEREHISEGDQLTEGHRAGSALGWPSSGEAGVVQNPVCPGEVCSESVPFLCSPIALF